MWKKGEQGTDFFFVIELWQQNTFSPQFLGKYVMIKCLHADFTKFKMKKNTFSIGELSYHF